MYYEILHLCPANIATGGTEGIHHLVSELNKNPEFKAKILYIGKDLSNPQPKVYEHYNCPYITSFPKDFKGIVIFPEVWGNRVVEPLYKDCLTIINWQGIDVYNWNVPAHDRGLFLKNKKTMHITMSEYGMNHLKKLGLNPIKIPDCINDAYLQEFKDEFSRKNTVLYNPVEIKMTGFQKTVMEKAKETLGIGFKPLLGFTQDQLIDLFQHSKLYIDFGEFSGRERLPREAVMCGCCILTSKKGTAGYYEDNPIPDKYKLNNVDTAIKMIREVLLNYDECKLDFDFYRQAMREDKEEYPKSVRRLCDEILSNYSNS